MKANEIEFGQTYAVKVSGKICPVRIRAATTPLSGRRHWIGINERTGREIVIKSPQRIRYAMPQTKDVT